MKLKVVLATICLFLTSIFCVPVFAMADELPSATTQQENELKCKEGCEKNAACLEQCSDLEKLTQIKKMLEETIATTENTEKNKKAIEAHKKALEDINSQIKELTETDQK